MRRVAVGKVVMLIERHHAHGAEMTGFNESWWIGLGGLHTLFAREHNAVCDELHSHYRSWTEERVHQTARLIVSALIAKIHTVEWTPAILGTRALDLGMHANWSGPRSRGGGPTRSCVPSG